MLQFLSILGRRPSSRRAAEGDPWRWRADPLSHPALAGMSERELGDLPLPPLRLRAEPGPTRRA